MNRALSLCFATVALALFVTAARAEEKAGQHGKFITGTIASVDPTGQKLVVKESDTSGTGQERTFTLDSSTKINCDAKSVQLSDLKPGMKVRVYTKRDDPNTVMRVEALDKNSDWGSGGGGR
jgi:Cu/Ag efflux protein CusF